MTEIPGLPDLCWPVDTACYATYEADFTEAVRARAEALAVTTLRRLTGFRVGGCPITIRPCKSSCAEGSLLPYYDYSMGSFHPHINAAGYWVNSCGCQTDCSCTELCEIELPRPVGEVVSVKVDGAVIPTTDYRLDGDRLVWVGAGDCPWPACQDMTKDDTQPGTFSVTYLNAYPVDGLASYAAGVLAVEYAKACNGDRCALPANVTAISRQGVTMEINSGAFPDGFTGIREVDAFISLWNPNALRQQATVWWPGKRTPRITG